ncbi:MAG: hypothetical protein RIB98_06575 [Acidimicrobiales bacterium]
MGKASSSKKVQRAARAAASSRGVGEKRERGFPLLVLAIVVLGVGLVIAARSSRDEAVAPFLSPTTHWHSALEITDCGEVAPTLLTQLDPDGIHTHADGLIHIHPFNSSATGTDARLGVFMDATGLRIDSDGIDATGSFDAGFPPIDNSTGCDGEDSEIVVTRWIVDGSGGPELETTYRDDFGDIRFLREREAFTVGKVPVGEDAPEPSAAILAQLDATTGTTNLESDTFDLPPLDDIDPDADPSTDDTLPGDTDTDDTVPEDTVPDDTVPADTE